MTIPMSWRWKEFMISLSTELKAQVKKRYWSHFSETPSLSVCLSVCLSLSLSLSFSLSLSLSLSLFLFLSHSLTHSLTLSLSLSRPPPPSLSLSLFLSPPPPSLSPLVPTPFAKTEMSSSKFHLVALAFFKFLTSSSLACKAVTLPSSCLRNLSIWSFRPDQWHHWFMAWSWHVTLVYDIIVLRNLLTRTLKPQQYPGIRTWWWHTRVPTVSPYVPVLDDIKAFYRLSRQPLKTWPNVILLQDMSGVWQTRHSTSALCMTSSTI